MPWISLQTHSQYSILDASASVKGLAKKAKSYGMSTLALTDHGNLFGAVEFFKACSAEGVKPIIGCELYVAPGSHKEKKRIPGQRAAYSMVLLAKNQRGYHHLCVLSSRGYLDGFYYYPRVDKELLREYSEGLVCLTGYVGSLLGERLEVQDAQGAEEELQWLREVYGEDAYLVLQRHRMQDEAIREEGLYKESWLLQKYQDYVERQERVNHGLLEWSRKSSIPCVATNDVHYMERQDWQAHEILLNIQSGEPCEVWERDAQGNPKRRVSNPKRQAYPSHEYYFKSPEEMATLFADCPEAIANTEVVAEKCVLELDFETKHYPVYLPPELEGVSCTKNDQAKAVEQYLWRLCEEGIPERYTPERLAKVREIYPDRDPLEVVRERLAYEMNVIVPKGMCDYLLIVWDFINWAKKRGIPVGPGRGSGAGSIILYLIGVTDIEPLRFSLFFERFINPERLSYPDIDVDICMDRRGEVIEYTLEKYGQENVAQIVTFGTMKAKMAIKDVGRVLSVPLAKVNAIAKLVPEDPNMTLDKALELDPDLCTLYQQDEEAKRVIDSARRLEGSIRNTGIHAAGVIICGEPLTQHIPIFRPKEAEMIATQFSMKPVEAVGMLKIDFLGLKTLTSIQHCVESIRESSGKAIDWVNLPLDDQKTFDLLNQGKTLGVFQLESAGMQDLARRLRLDRFEEIIAVGALYRPGPMDMIPSFINRKHGLEPIEYDHEWMRQILDETYGIMVYQEQVMQIAQKLANYSLGEGDVLRRAMGKKDHAQMEKEREKFRRGALENHIPEERSMAIFDKMEKFASYGFNKSHAAAYGYLSYVTAYFKANYPGEWMAALMTCDRDDTAKVGKFIRECQAMDIPILPPDINEAGAEFKATPHGIRFAMSGVKGVGEGVVEAILHERKRKGPFKGLYDFFERMDSRKVGKKVVELLVGAGCFDFTGWSRDALRLSIEPMADTAAKEQKEAARGVMSLFSLIGETASSQFEKEPEVKEKSSPLKELFKEKELLGFFLTGHPLSMYRDILGRLSCIPLTKVVEMDQDAVFRSAFIIETVQVRLSNRTQKKFAITTISDGIDRYELPIWPELFDEKGALIQENQLVYAVLSVDRSEGSLRLSCRWLDDLTRADEFMVQACDQAYDKAKMQVARGAYQKSRGDNAKARQPVEAKPVTIPSVKVAFDATGTGLHPLLRLRRLAATHPGQAKLKLEFQRAGQVYAEVHAADQYSILPNEEVLAEIRALPGVLKVAQSGG